MDDAIISRAWPPQAAAAKDVRDSTDATEVRGVMSCT